MMLLLFIVAVVGIAALAIARGFQLDRIERMLEELHRESRKGDGNG